MDFVICNERQKILDADGHVLVTGGPGCGKTTIALLKAQKRIESGLASGQTVLFLSFSRAAVARVVEASARQFPKELQKQLSIQTFHSFFWEIVRGYGYLLGAPDRLRLLPPQDEAALRNGEDGEDDLWTAERERLFREEGRVAFDLFASKANALLQKSERIRAVFASRHPLIVVDEAQDTAEDQWQSVRLLAEHAQVICLADLEQQIYDFRAGVTVERLTHIMAALNPLRIDLQTENHRSPDADIVAFGNDILLDTPRAGAYKGVSRFLFRPDKAMRDTAIRKSVGIVSASVRRATGNSAQSIAVLASWGKGVNIITKALTGDEPTSVIPHSVLIDQAPVLLASRLVAFLLEPRMANGQEFADLAEALDLAAAVHRACGGTTSITQAGRLSGQASAARNGRPPRSGSVGASLCAILRAYGTHRFTGDPRRDWLDARGSLAGSGKAGLIEMANYAEQLPAFQRGQHIASALSGLWQTQGHYATARHALDSAIVQDQLLSVGDDMRGIHVMTLHKSKSKEFDAVVIIDDSHNSPLIYCKEQPPFPRSRKLFRVGITRARHHVLLLTDMYSPSPLLARLKL